MSEQRTYRRDVEPAARPPEWDRGLTRFWPEAVLLLLTLLLGYGALTTPAGGGPLALVGRILLPLGPLLGLGALLAPRSRRRPGTLVAGRSDDGGLVLRADPSSLRLTFYALLAAGLAGPFVAVDTFLQGTGADLPPVWLTMPMFLATLAGLPMAYELGRGRIRGAEMSIGAETLVVDALMTTRTVMWSRVRLIEPVRGAGARVRITCTAPIGRQRRGSTGRGRATTVVEDPQLSEVFSLAAYPGDPGVLLSVLRALAEDPEAAGRLLTGPEPGAAAVDL